MENNIEVKKAWYINYEAEIIETEAFQFQEEGTYGTTEVTYYMANKGWKKGSSWSGDSVVFTIEDAQVAKKKQMENRLKTLQENKVRNEEQIAIIEAGLSAKQ